MRRFEFSDGKSNKFWEVEVKGSELHLRWGRIGTDGQSKVKDFASQAKATEEAEKQIASKQKKGYSEVSAGVLVGAAVSVASTPVAAPVTTPAPPPAPVKPSVAPPPPAEPESAEPAGELPDESKPVLPESWQRMILPRRDSSNLRKPNLVKPETALQYAQDVVGKARTQSKARLKTAEEGFQGKTCPPEVMGWALAHVEGGRKARTAFTDYLYQSLGMAQAVEAVLDTMALVQTDSGYPDWNWDRDFMFRLRTLLATCDDGEYQKALQLAEARLKKTSREVDGIVLAFLFPERQEWAWEALKLDDRRTRPLLALTILDVDSVIEVIGKVGPWSFINQGRNPFPTLIDGLGLSADRILSEFVRRPFVDADTTKAFAPALATLPTELAVESLLELCEKSNHGISGLQTATQNFPCTALKVLARRRDQDRWVLSILKTHPGSLDAVRSSLSVEDLTYLESLANSSAEVETAELADCPEFLKKPRWENRTNKKSVTLELEPLDVPAGLAWEPGEKEKWRSPLTKDVPDQSLADYEKSLPTWRRGRHNTAHNLVEAPLSAARELLPTWLPEDSWYADRHIRGIIHRFEMEVLPSLHYYAEKCLKDAVGAFGPLIDAQLICKAAEAYSRLKSARKPAAEYLLRHPEAVARTLIPTALGKAKKERSYAENALMLLGTEGHRSKVLLVAQEYGEQAAQAVEDLLDRDPLDLLPKKMPSLPDWLNPEFLRRPKLSSGKALPDEAMRHLTTMLAISQPDAVYHGVELVKQACTPESLAEYAWSLFELWLEIGAPSKENWAFQALGWLGNDATARRLTPLLKKWPGEGGHARAVLGLQVLTDIGTDVALMHLYGLSQKLKFKGLKNSAGEKVSEIAENRGLTTDELGDRLVPDLDLEEDGSMLLDYGPRQFRVGFDELLKPYILDQDGKRLKSLPKPGKKDDEELAGPAFDRFKALKKDVKTVAQQQLFRLEKAMCMQRRWSVSDFKTFFIEHPLVIHLVRRLVWATFENNELRETFRVAEDLSLADAQDEEWNLPTQAVVGLPHRLEIPDKIQGQWGELFSDYELLQPFEQLGRSLYERPASEEKSKELTILKGTEIESVRVLSLESRGWRRGEALDGGVVGWMLKELPDGKVAYLNLDPGIVIGDPTAFPDLKLMEVTLGDEVDSWSAPAKYTFGSLTAVGYSELVRDLESLRS